MLLSLDDLLIFVVSYDVSSCCLDYQDPVNGTVGKEGGKSSD